jgi:hypothetical protein
VPPRTSSTTAPAKSALLAAHTAAAALPHKPRELRIQIPGLVPRAPEARANGAKPPKAGGSAPSRAEPPKAKASGRASPRAHAHGADEPRFPTADRMILEELKAAIRARDAQFALKNGAKHHGFAARDVPYPRAYERIDLDQ